jgi:hypothetical protein
MINGIAAPRCCTRWIRLSSYCSRAEYHPEQFGRALMEPMPPMIEQAEKDNGQDAG